MLHYGRDFPQGVSLKLENEGSFFPLTHFLKQMKKPENALNEKAWTYPRIVLASTGSLLSHGLHDAAKKLCLAELAFRFSG